MTQTHLEPFRMASAAAGAGSSGVSASSGGPAWLLEAKVLAPQPPARYVRRAPLLARLDGLLERRLTVLQAPAGFGKTTVLADVARGVRERGAVVGWISLDGDDTPNLFGSYLAAAFEHAGLDVALLNAHDAWSSSPAVQQMGMLARAIQQHGAPCLLVLDEVDRLPRRTVELVDLLVKRAPANLHVAMALRTDPGLDLAPHVLDDGAVLVGAQEFRFSRADIARFFQGGLSRRELVAVEERTAGWAVALMVHRNVRASEAAGRGAEAAKLTESYLGIRLLRDLSAEDRACLLDLAVFDWIDADLARDVLGSGDALARVAALPSLEGLLLPVGRDGAVRRLHPLLREYCLDRFAVEAPKRRRSLHRQAALALAGRGHLTPAWRQAAEAGDSRLVGELIERFGVLELWLREGVTRLISAGRFLTPETLAERPRLALLQCLILRLSARFDEANALFEAVARKTDGFTRDRDGGDADALAMDRVFTEGVLAAGADRLPPAELASRLPTGGSARARHTMFCFACYERARFDECRRHGRLAQTCFGDDVRFGDIFVNLCLGMSAMAQGRVREASAAYGRARQGARKFFASDPCLTVSTDALAIELDLERNRERKIQQRTLQSMAEVRGVWSEVYATAIAVTAELTFAQYSSEAAIQLLSKAVDDVRVTGIASLSHHTAALLAQYLVEVERVEEAGSVWRDHGLACDADALLDLDRQSWRTMEALSCARVRLLAAQGEWAAAEELATRLREAASERGLVRTQLRGLALSMIVAHGAGRLDRAVARLVEFLRGTREADYLRPLVRHRDISVSVLRRVLATVDDEDVRQAAESVLLQLDAPAAPTAAVFSARELEVLAGIRAGLRNKEIAGRLGMTDEGVRYHLKNIYRKTGASRRTDVLRHAQSLGER